MPAICALRHTSEHRNVGATPTAAQLATWAETAIPEGLTVFHFPDRHWRRLRTSDMLERLSRENKRRTRVATLFPNTDACLRLVTAVVREISEEWQTGRR